MSSNLNWNNVRSLNGLGFVSAADIAQIGDLTIEGNLTVDGDATIVGVLTAGTLDVTTLTIEDLNVTSNTTLSGYASYNGNEIMTTADVRWFLSAGNTIEIENTNTLNVVGIDPVGASASGSTLTLVLQEDNFIIASDTNSASVYLGGS